MSGTSANQTCWSSLAMLQERALKGGRLAVEYPVFAHQGQGAGKSVGHVPHSSNNQVLESMKQLVGP
jgi:hypothetical protein